MSEQAIVAARLETQAGFAAVLRQRPFVVLWLSESISLIGDRLLAVALAALIYEMTRSPAAVGLTLAALSAVQNYHLALVMSAVLGLAMVAVHVTGQTVILEETPETLRGRVTGVFQALLGGASFLAMGMGGAMAGWLGATAVLVGAGFMVTAAGLGVWVMYDRMDEK